MLKWLSRSDKKPRLRFQVWLNEGAKLPAVFRIIAENQVQNRTTLLVTHFAEMYQVVSSLLDEQSIAYSPLKLSEDIQSATFGDEDCKVYLTSMDDLLEAPTVGQATSVSPPVQVIAVEAHPLENHNRAIPRLAKSLSGADTSEFHVSLDDPVMKIFVNDTTTKALLALGMKDDNSIEHAMVNKSMIRAMQKIEKSATGDQPADSAVHWLSINCPELSSS